MDGVAVWPQHRGRARRVRRAVQPRHRRRAGAAGGALFADGRADPRPVAGRALRRRPPRAARDVRTGGDVARDGVPPLTATVDLHLHSTASDGELAPAEVVARARAAGLAAMALTDHDTLAGLPEARTAGARLGVRVVAGCEFSTAAPWGEMHVLG